MKIRIILTLVALILVGLIYMVVENNAPAAPLENGGGVVVQ